VDARPFKTVNGSRESGTGRKGDDAANSFHPFQIAFDPRQIGHGHDPPVTPGAHSLRNRPWTLWPEAVAPTLHRVNVRTFPPPILPFGSTTSTLKRDTGPFGTEHIRPIRAPQAPAKHRARPPRRAADTQHFPRVRDLAQVRALRRIPPRQTGHEGGLGEGSLHIQTVNDLTGLTGRLKGWIRRFDGVATKCLDHYLLYFQRRGAGPFPVMAARGGWASARSLRERPMALT